MDFGLPIRSAYILRSLEASKTPSCTTAMFTRASAVRRHAQDWERISEEITFLWEIVCGIRIKALALYDNADPQR